MVILKMKWILFYTSVTCNDFTKFFKVWHGYYTMLFCLTSNQTDISIFRVGHFNKKRSFLFESCNIRMNFCSLKQQTSCRHEVANVG